MSNKIKVLLADDTLIAREGWRRILETAPDIEIVGESKTAAETLRRVKELKPDILLMDLKWFGDETAGWTAIREIKQENLDTRVIAVTGYEGLIRDARLAGADSALLKTFTRDELLSEIHEQASKPVRKDAPVDVIHIHEKLTSRELQVLELLEQGHSDKDIANLLSIAPTTAKNHVKSILEKIGARNRTQAVSRGRQLGILK